VESASAVVGGGCFWCLEAVFQEVRGVSSVQSGYAGGHVENPTYKEVCSGTTGHAEVVRVIYDPSVVSYRELLEVFFAVHDPTTPDRQGADVGPQYRSIILYADEAQERTARELLEVFFAVHDPTTPDRQGADVGPQYRSIILYADEAQERTARELLAELDEEGPWDDPIVTELKPLDVFHPAEAAHDDYFRRNPYQPYCQAVISPKVSKFRERFRGTLLGAGGGS
jgi:peptide-methionine (S)-S-oxide reductase